MAKNKDRVRITSPFGRVVWAQLNRPSTKFDKNGVYEISLVFDDAEAPEVVDFVEKIKTHAQKVKAAAAASNPKVAKYKLSPEIGPDQDKQGNEIPGTIRIKAKLRASGTRDDGTQWTDSVVVVDAKNVPIPKNVIVGGGSTARVQLDLTPFTMDATKTSGVSLKLRAVQVKDLKEYKPAGSFDEVDGYQADTDDEDQEVPFEATSGDKGNGDF